MAKTQREEMKKVLNEPIKNHMRFLLDVDYGEYTQVMCDLDPRLQDVEIQNCVFNALETLINMLVKHAGYTVKEVMTILIKELVPYNVEKFKEEQVDGKLIN